MSMKAKGEWFLANLAYIFIKYLITYVSKLLVKLVLFETRNIIIIYASVIEAEA